MFSPCQFIPPPLYLFHQSKKVSEFKMKKDVHPKYQKVLFVDSSTGHRFVIGSTLQPKETEKFEGKEYPVYQLSTSSYSHPFFTGSNKFVDAEGRVDKFKKRYEAAAQKGAAKDAEQGKEQDKGGQEQKKKGKAKK
jgi:large subunit ribosomal protein L31